jgi:anti-anti-sigma factor
MMETHTTVLTPGTAAISVSGKVMMGAESEQIEQRVEEALRQGTRTIIFDISGVTSIDSTGVGRFISSFNKIMEAGGDMRIAGATGHVFHTFHVSLLDTVFSFYPTVEDAAKA